jgi:basic amino acid/polyamine antiporter, APA family
MAQFERSLGLLDAVMVVSGSMIGSGIFIVSADMMRQLGSPSWVLLAWLVAGVMTVLAALSYGELAGMMPKAGGQYVYIQRAFGRFTAFLYGWSVFTVVQTGVIAAVAMAFSKFTAVFCPALAPENVLIHIGSFGVNAAQVFAIASIVLLTAFNVRGVREGKTLQTVFTMAKVLALLGLIALGMAVGFGKGVLAENFSLGWNASMLDVSGKAVPLAGSALLSALGLAMVGSLFSSDAWNNITFIAGEVREPRRNIPLSLFIGTLLVTALYVLANVAYFSLLPVADVQHAPYDRVGTAAARVIFGESGALLMAGLIMVSTFGCNNGCIMAGGRLYYAMAQDGLFFKRAGVLNTRGVPARALWLQCAWASVLCLSGKYGDLLNYVTFASLLFYVVTVLGLFRLRRTEPLAERPYRAFGYPLLPALYVAGALAFCANLLMQAPVQAGTGLLIVALGAVVYALRAKVV